MSSGSCSIVGNGEARAAKPNRYYLAGAEDRQGQSSARLEIVAYAGSHEADFPSGGRNRHFWRGDVPLAGLSDAALAG